MTEVEAAAKVELTAKGMSSQQGLVARACDHESYDKKAYMEELAKKGSR